MMRNSGGNWGYVAKTLHWSAAALIITMLGLGLAMVHGGLGSGAKFETYQLHNEKRTSYGIRRLAFLFWR